MLTADKCTVSHATEMSCMQVVNIPNSMTVLPELLPYSIEMVRSLMLRLFQHCCGAANRSVLSPGSWTLLATLLHPSLFVSLSMHGTSTARRQRGWTAPCTEGDIVTANHVNVNMQEAGAQARRKLTGIMNYTNPGAISHNEVLELYKQYIDPEFKWSNFSIEEQAKVIVAPRSNNLLDTTRVRSEPRADQLLGCRQGSRPRPGASLGVEYLLHNRARLPLLRSLVVSLRPYLGRCDKSCNRLTVHIPVGLPCSFFLYDRGGLINPCKPAQLEKEFPEMLPIKESLIKYVFEPNTAKKEETLKAVRAMRGR